MNNKKGDFLWGFVLLLWILVLVVPAARTVFIAVTEAHPYIGGFVKFFILATMGDLLGVRILKGEWILPKGFIAKAVVWGILGMAITLVFTVFTAGAGVAQSLGRLPFAGSKFAQAFFGSTIMNLTFGPMLYIYHKFGDLYIDLKIEKNGNKFTVKEMVDRIDWYTLVSFSWLKTCTLIWIPCHTIVFLLPPQYRVLASAFLSVLLGILVAVSKKGAQKSAVELNA
ncbi:hypothetical protein M2651_02580 [Clostridium sp. SYSU_GA19001]|uniref:hypothetical protein n=1 Tax=Clostridium caldaquaticum TaxID=2940653 RepID=UPI002076E417|nr:hypothetical protein [Clostridium caldaquaticum]MCM8709909.1 hypothetical protein [Clostridium caldaquaticum]